MAIFDDLYKKLNNKQKESVRHIDGPMMVLAGAGTGKTQVLAMRIANLMRETGVGLNNILCLTFTDAGVNAMRERLIKILGSEGHGARVSTFHSFASEVMSEYPEKFIKTNELLPLTELEKVRLMTKILENLPFGNPLKHQNNPLFYLNDISSRISELKRENVSVSGLIKFTESQEKFAETTKEIFELLFSTHASVINDLFLDNMSNELITLGRSNGGNDYLFKSAGLLLARARELALVNPTKTGKISYSKLKDEMKRFYNQVSGKLDQQRALAAIYQEYLDRMADIGRFDFEDMINNVLELMESDLDLRLDFQEKYQYILVDEYQDTNSAQNKLVDIFGRDVESPNIFVVGDDDQAIFRFQGASLENVVGFQRKYVDSVKIVSLLENYRSQPTILLAADKLIQNNQFRAAVAIPNVVKMLNPGLKSEPKLIEVLSFDSNSSELYWISKKIKSLLVSGVMPSEIAVLAKTNAELINLLPYIKKLNIPFSVSKNENAFENTVVSQFLRLIVAIKNPYDNQNFFFLLESASAGIAAIDFLKINKYVLEHPRAKISYFDFLGDISKLSEVGVVDTLSCSALYSNILRWRDLASRVSTMEVVSDIISSSGILDLCLSDGENELENLRALGALVSEFGRSIQSDRTMTFYVLTDTVLEMVNHDLALSMGQRGVQIDRVSLTTVHKSKGLEYRYVFLINAIEKKWEKGGRSDRLSLPLNLFENDLGVAARQQEEEARRLFYVAVTRTREELFVSYARADFDGRAQIVSQFVSELGSDLIVNRTIILTEEEEREKLLTGIMGMKRPESYDDITKAFLREKLLNYSLSASHLNAYRKCPRMFYYQYFIRAPIVPSTALILGSAAHKAVENLFESNKNGGVISSNELIDVYTKQLERSWLTGASFSDALERGKLFLTKYYEYRIGNLPKDIKIESDFSYHGICLGEIRLTGKMDMIEITDEISKRCVVYDFKTGDPSKGIRRVGRDEDTWRQVVFYKLLTKLSKRFGYVMEYGIVEFIEPNLDGSFESVEVNVTEDDLQMVNDQIREMWSQLQSLNFSCNDMLGECKYCKNILRVGDGEGF